MKYLKIISNFGTSLSKLQPFALLSIRLILAYGFYEPAKMKLQNINGIAQWFESMNYPLPLISAYMATITETAGVILLFVGFATRFISIPLMFTMVVAITTVHLGNGFAAGNNGFEIPLYYLIMLFILLVSGPGKLSLDYVFSKK